MVSIAINSETILFVTEGMIRIQRPYIALGEHKY